MEIKRECLQRQQMILKFLGYYQGACDGIWSEKTIAAKRDFEVSGKFHPAYPNNGMPFDPTSKLPSGIMLDFSRPRTGLLIHVDIPQEYYSQLASELVTVDEKVVNFDPNESTAPSYDPLLTQTVDDVKPVVAPKAVLTEQLIDKAAEPVQVEPEQSATLIEGADPIVETAPVVNQQSVDQQAQRQNDNRERQNDNRDRKHFHQNKPR